MPVPALKKSGIPVCHLSVKLVILSLSSGCRPKKKK